MRSNLHRHGDNLASEQILAGLHSATGKHRPSGSCTNSSLPVAESSTTWSAPWWRRVLRPQKRRRAWASLGRGRRTGGMVDAVGNPGSARPRDRAGGVDVKPPRIDLAALPTPLARGCIAWRPALQTGPLYVKRDDLTGFGVAGNKARALEFLMGAAVAERCRRLRRGWQPIVQLLCGGRYRCRALVWTVTSVPWRPTSGASVNVELARAQVRACCSALSRPARSSTTLSSTTRMPCVLRGDGLPGPRGGATPVGGSATPMPRVSWPSSVTVSGSRSEQ